MQVQSSAAEGGFVNPSGQQPQQPFFVSTAPVVRLNHRQAAAAGVVLIIIACLSILSNAIELTISTGALSSQYFYFSDRIADGIRGMAFQSTGFVGHGFWCGIMYVIAGSFGIGAAVHKTTCKINTFLVLTILGAVFSGVQISMGGLGTGLVNSVLVYQLDRCPKPTLICREVKTILAMEILQVILGVYAFVMCLWSSILCCIGKRCCTSTPVMAFQMVPTGQQMTVVNQQQQQQPVAAPVGYPQAPPNPPSYGYNN